ncbi:MFS transporter [Mycolicibacter senuensis]|uniref:MFS transporter n=1 Tax=Mycolicibacter senuensis TaxID=386913 RepID=UPI000DCE7E3A|nr:MFS transporter [Mycolicibacter senuensis]RAU94276.1 MFS transporter [Mycolicibacter senuensis]
MMLGFFVILVDSTIVAVANPSIMAALDVGYDTVIWVTSAYLLGYAVPLLVTGRLGDQFGPKNLYLAGLAVFTGASLWCGLAGGIDMLITARAVQGIGAALLTPQTLTVITRTFPADRRGMAMSVWGATAGVATLIGPLAGGALVDGLGWEWIFFVNVPVGVLGLVLAYVLIPDLPVHRHRFDLIGVALSGIGMFLLVFALQEGESQSWAPWIWALIVGGVGCLALFVYWQVVTGGEPLIPLHIFRDLDFGLANIGVAVIGFAATAMVLPVMFYAQAVCGMSPTRAALLTAPMAIASGVLAPVVGTIVDRAHPRTMVGFGFSTLAIALTWLSIEMTPVTPVWRLLLPFTAVGIGMAFIWSPLAATATRNLPPHLAGAGSGVYNATRQVGAVLGSAAMAAFMTSRISTNLPPMPGGLHPGSGNRNLPDFLHEPFAAAMSESTLLPAFVALFGVVAALFMVGFVIAPARRTPRPVADLDDDDLDCDDFGDVEDLDEPADRRRDSDVPVLERVSLPRHFAAFSTPRSDEADDVAAADEVGDDDEPTELIPVVVPSQRDIRPASRRPGRHDAHQVAWSVRPVRSARPIRRDVRPPVRHNDPATEPLTVEIPPVTVRPRDEDATPLQHNGFHVGTGRRYRRAGNGEPVPDVLAKFGITGRRPRRRNRHYRDDADDTDELVRYSHRDD